MPYCVLYFYVRHLVSFSTKYNQYFICKYNFILDHWAMKFQTCCLMLKWRACTLSYTLPFQKKLTFYFQQAVWHHKIWQLQSAFSSLSVPPAFWNDVYIYMRNNYRWQKIAGRGWFFVFLQKEECITSKWLLEW